MNKKGALGTSMLWVLVCCVVVLIVFVGMIALAPKEAVKVEVTGGGTNTYTPTPSSGGGGAATGANDCASGLTTDFKWNYIDGYQKSRGTISYLGAAGYLIPVSSGLNGLKQPTNATSSTSGTYVTDSALLPCSVNQLNKYELVVLTTEDHNAGSVVEITAAGQEVTPATVEVKGPIIEKTIVGATIGPLQFEVVGTDGYHTLNETVCNVGTTTQTWNDFNGSDGSSGCKVADPFDGNNYDDLGVDASDKYEVTLKIKTNNTNTQFGEAGLKVWMCNDASPTYWKKPSVSYVGGGELTERKASMPPKALSKLGDYEYCYVIMDASASPLEASAKKTPFDNINEAAYKIVQESTTSDPGASQDPAWIICAEGRYKSSQQQDKILVDCYKDDTSQTQVWSNTQSKLTIDVTA